ncbi:MAG: hypothetical protein ACHP84_11010 [Caulobacterales bacterium]
MSDMNKRRNWMLGCIFAPFAPIGAALMFLPGALSTPIGLFFGIAILFGLIGTLWMYESLAILVWRALKAGDVQGTSEAG